MLVLIQRYDEVYGTEQKTYFSVSLKQKIIQLQSFSLSVSKFAERCKGFHSWCQPQKNPHSLPQDMCTKLKPHSIENKITLQKKVSA